MSFESAFGRISQQEIVQNKEKEKGIKPQGSEKNGSLGKRQPPLIFFSGRFTDLFWAHSQFFGLLDVPLTRTKQPPPHTGTAGKRLRR